MLGFGKLGHICDGQFYQRYFEVICFFPFHFVLGSLHQMPRYVGHTQAHPSYSVSVLLHHPVFIPVSPCMEPFFFDRMVEDLVELDAYHTEFGWQY